MVLSPQNDDSDARKPIPTGAATLEGLAALVVLLLTVPRVIARFDDDEAKR